MVDAVKDVCDKNNNSFVTDGIAKIPVATQYKLGLVKTTNTNGIYVSPSTGFMNVQKALDAGIEDRTEDYKPIVPSNLDYAVKAAMCDGKGAAWTADEQKAARERMSVENGSDFELLVDATLEEEAHEFNVTFPYPVREVLYHFWWFNNNGAKATMRIFAGDSAHTSVAQMYLLRYDNTNNNGWGYVYNGYLRHNGNMKQKGFIGYVSSSGSSGWTQDVEGNGNIAYMNYPSDASTVKFDFMKFILKEADYVLNAGAVVKVWGR